MLDNENCSKVNFLSSCIEMDSSSEGDIMDIWNGHWYTIEFYTITYTINSWSIFWLTAQYISGKDKTFLVR